MFMSKKKMVRQYLDRIPKEKYTPFDLLLFDYLDGSFEKNLKSIGLKSNCISVAWDDDVHFIMVESRYHAYTMDLTIYTDLFVIFFCDDELPEELEPDACKEQDLPLESKEKLFDVIKEKLAGLD